MAPHILMVDDQADLLAPLARLLERDGYRVSLAVDGAQALEKAGADKPDLVLCDVQMPGMDGYEVVRRLRSLRPTAFVPILFLSGLGETPEKVRGLRVGADDYLTKPVVYEELKARLEAVFARAQRSVGGNPITGLPGSAALEREVQSRVAAGQPFALASVDIDFFRPYNERYGFAKGDEVLRTLGQVLADALENEGSPEDFLAHAGGDDFAVLAAPERLDAVLARAMEMFDWLAPGFYDEADRERGGINADDRRGNPLFHPILRLSIGVATTETRRLSSYAEAAGVASEMRRYAKTLKRRASFVAKDRRRSAEAEL